MMMSFILINNSIFAQTFNDRIVAAEKVARESEECLAISPFYYEIGTKSHGITGFSIGDNAPTAYTNMKIASASKWIFGAFAIEKLHGKLTSSQIKLLNFTSGYDQFDNCANTNTISECQKSGTNGDRTFQDIGKFYYNGGHLQKLGVELGIGAYDSEILAKDVNATLGLNISYFSPQLAGAVQTSADEYAKFLRKIMNNDLIIGKMLGLHAVCASPTFCPDAAISSPIVNYLDYDYSLAHWVENDATLGDGSFSSAGAFGFYPWIDKTKTFYGIIAREKIDSGAGQKSMFCGQKIRNAFMKPNL
jgi:hypothetical protein